MSLDTDTTSPTTDEATAKPVPFKDTLASFTRLDAFAKAVNDYAQAQRPAILDQMIEVGEQLDTKSFNIRIGGEVVATATVTEPEAKIIVSDEKALLEWVAENHPSEVETIVQIRPSFKKLLTDKRTIATDGLVIDKETGEEVPGLKHKPAADPTAFSVRWKADKKAPVVDGLFADFAPVLGITAGGEK